MVEQARSIEALAETALTETLPEGALFVSPDGVLYQVVLAEGAGFRKAEQWPWSTSNASSEYRQPVALVAGSFLARNYPVVDQGRRLPTLTRAAFVDRDNQPAQFSFPNERLAKLAAQLDETLTPQSGLAAYIEEERWVLGDGQHIFRVYHYAVSASGQAINLSERYTRENIRVRDCNDGPVYWQYLPGWKKPDVARATVASAAALKESATSSVDQPPAPSISPKPVPTGPIAESITLPPGPVTTSALAPPAPPGEAASPQRVVPVSPTPTPTTQPNRSIERRFDFRSLFGLRPRDRKDLSNAQPVPQPVIDTLPQSMAATAPEEKPEVPASPPEPPAQPSVPMPSEEPALPPASLTQPDTSTLPPELAKAATSRSRKARRTLMMVLSVDLGYGYTKGVGADGVRFSFPSVIGTAEDIRFATNLINGSADRTVKFGDAEFFYGNQALLQSRIQSTIFDRSRVHDQLYKMLFVAALVEMNKQAPEIERIRLVTGLPVEFFNDRADVVSLFEGTYHIATDRPFTCAVESVFVAPQPFGSLFRELLNDQGRITSSQIEKGRIGVIDVGTYTTDFIVSDELRYVQRFSGSARIGWSKVITKMEQALGDAYGLELTPHQVDRALSAGEVRVRGQAMPLKELMEPAIDEVRAAIIARARDLWGEGASLDTILVTGGGAAYLYELIREVYPHARLLDDAFWANAEGLYRFGRRPATFKE